MDKRKLIKTVYTYEERQRDVESQLEQHRMQRILFARALELRTWTQFDVYIFIHIYI